MEAVNNKGKAAAQVRFDALREQLEYERSLGDESEFGFNYTAVDSLGVVVKGSVQDKKLQQADYKIKRAGLKIEAVSPRKLNPVQNYLRNRQKTPGRMEMAQHAEQLGELLEVIPSPVQVCNILSRTSSNKQISLALEAAANRLFEGDMLWMAFGSQKDSKGRPFYPLPFLYALKIGQAVAALPDPENPNGKSVGAYYLLLRFYSETLKKAHATSKKIQKALIYPVTVLGFCFVGFLIETYGIMPMLKPLFQGLLQGKDDSLPFLTQWMLDIGEFFASIEGVAFLLLSIASVIGAFYYLFFVPRGIDFRERMMLKLPYFGSFYRDYNASQIARTMAMVWEGNEDIKESLAIVRDTATHPQYREMMAHILRELTVSSPPLPELFAVYDHLMGEEFASTIQTVQETGMGQRQFYSYAKVLEQRADEKLDSVIDKLQNLAIAVPAVFVVIILLASYLPLFQLVGKLASPK